LSISRLSPKIIYLKKDCFLTIDKKGNHPVNPLIHELTSLQEVSRMIAVMPKRKYNMNNG